MVTSSIHGKTCNVFEIMLFSLVIAALAFAGCDKKKESKSPEGLQVVPPKESAVKPGDELEEGVNAQSVTAFTRTDKGLMDFAVLAVFREAGDMDDNFAARIKPYSQYIESSKSAATDAIAKLKQDYKSREAARVLGYLETMWTSDQEQIAYKVKAGKTYELVFFKGPEPTDDDWEILDASRRAKNLSAHNSYDMDGNPVYNPGDPAKALDVLQAVSSENASPLFVEYLEKQLAEAQKAAP